jgi:ornithine decarboxylase
LPSITPHYAVKANPDPIILKWLKESATVNVDCASPAEMKLALAAGYKPSQIIYANTMKSVNDVPEAADLGVSLTTIDSVEGAEQIAAQDGWRPDVLVRLAVDDSAARSPFSIKFGAAQPEWKKIMDALRALKLPFKGVSFHVGSGSASPAAFSKAIKKCWHFQEHTDCGPMPIVDIGGGFLHEEESFAGVAGAINEEIARWPGKKPAKWIAEPGRFFCNPVQTMHVPIVFAKENDECVRYIIDDSIYGQFNSIVMDHSRPEWVMVDANLWPVNRPRTTKNALFFGKTCDSMDFIAMEKNAPKYEVGDVMIFPNMGAYTSATATTFNGFPLIPKVYLNEPLPDVVPSKNENVVYPISVSSEISLSLQS